MMAGMTETNQGITAASRQMLQSASGAEVLLCNAMKLGTKRSAKLIRNMGWTCVRPALIALASSA